MSSIRKRILNTPAGLHTRLASNPKPYRAPAHDRCRAATTHAGARRPQCQRHAGLRLARAPKSTGQGNWGAVLSLLQLSARLRCGVVNRDEGPSAAPNHSIQKNSLRSSGGATEREILLSRGACLGVALRRSRARRYGFCVDWPCEPGMYQRPTRPNGAAVQRRRQLEAASAPDTDRNNPPRAPWMALTLLRRKPHAAGGGALGLLLG
jgi:hypothetical protein